MCRLLWRWLVAVVALYIAVVVVSWLVPGRVFLTGIIPSLVAPIVLAAINVTVRPVLLFVTFPITALTLGLFIFVINAFSVWLTAKIVPGFTVLGLWPALLLTIAISIVGWGVNMIRREPER